MNIYSQREQDTLILTLSGRLDTVSAPQLEASLKDQYDGITRLVLDFKDINYVSSAGLRVLLIAAKQMSRRGSLVLRNVAPIVMDVFKMTGFDKILTIE